MAINFRLSTKKKGTDTAIMIDVKTRMFHQRANTGVRVPAEYWNTETERANVPKFRMMTPAQAELIKNLTAANTALSELFVNVQTAINSHRGEAVPADFIKTIVEGEKERPQAAEHKPQPQNFVDGFIQYYENADVSEARKGQSKVVANALKRYEFFNGVVLMADTFDTDTLKEIYDFLKNEHIYMTLPTYKRRVPLNDQLRERGSNTIRKELNFIKAYTRQLLRAGKMQQNPFEWFDMPKEVYGTPYYLTIEERNMLSGAEMGAKMAIQRDIFIFQCLVGCRVSDLSKLRKENVTQDERGRYWLSYVPVKTLNKKADTINVPLTEQAVALLERYSDTKGGKLFPFISTQKYNDTIKRMLEVAGVTRYITILDSVTHKPKQVRICDVASSHMARRTFCGNLYKNGAETAKICKMSGHSENSKAFARYRAIDNDILEQTINLLY